MILFAIISQLADATTTTVGIWLCGAVEANPMLAGLNDGQIADWVILWWKALVPAVFFLFPRQVSVIATIACLVIGIDSFAVSAHNISVIV
jgi:hypothetical protein